MECYAKKWHGIDSILRYFHHHFSSTSKNEFDNYISDVDECANETHNCSENTTCTYTPDSYNCQCLSGYKENEKKCSGTNVWI
jgi:hypothetical protein